MEFVFLYLFFCFLFALVGNDRNIGYWGAFLLCFFFTPILGAIIASLCRSKKSVQLERQAFQTIVSSNKPEPSTVAEELKNLQDLKEKNLVSEEEYQRIRQSIMQKYNMA